jgi:hypothetical protein
MPTACVHNEHFNIAKIDTVRIVTVRIVVSLCYSTSEPGPGLRGLQITSISALVKEPVVKRRNFVEIMRSRVQGALASSNGTSVRVLCAPHGGGKTTALLHYAAQHSDVAMIKLYYRATKHQVAQLLAGVENAREIVVDDADLASPGGLQMLFEEIEARHATCRYLLGVSSRTRIENRLRHGIVHWFDPSLLLFSSSEIRKFAEVHGIDPDDLDVEEVKYETDGWPVAVSWIIRDAVRDGCSRGGAFDEWCRRNVRPLLEFVAASQAGGASMEAFLSAALSVAESTSQRTLDRLVGEGYPVLRIREGLRPYRIFMRLDGNTVDGSLSFGIDNGLILSLFGRFSCSIRGRPVTFVRRRDQNLLTFVALAPGGSVTRAEVLRAFWSDRTPTVASQALRTALCRLRRALSDAAENDAEHYVRVDERISLDLDHVSIDVRRFMNHIACAKVGEEQNKRSVARNHYLEAQRLYTGSLLSSEAVEPTFAPRIAEYEGHFAFVQGQLAEFGSK